MNFGSHVLQRVRYFLIPVMTVFALFASMAQSQTAPKTATFNDYILHAVRKMPKGGGYSTGSQAAENLGTKGIVWDENRKRLILYPRGAQPSFCSSACYLVLLTALQHCESRRAMAPLPPEAWKYMAIYQGQKDGEGIWGRVNANGPGMAKLVSDLKAGVNFTDLKYARPGDFMKIFWNEHIGKKEYGHLVVFLRAYKEGDETMVEFWSSNSGSGYSIKAVNLASIQRHIFTRVMYPAAFARTPSLPWSDEWLHSLLSEAVSYREVAKKCHIR